MTQSHPEEILTPAQIERRAQLKRYNRLTIYLPITFMGVLIAVVVGLMLWQTVFPSASEQTDWASFVSGSADMIIIFAMLTLMLSVVLIPISAAGWIWYTWQNPRPVETWLQRWLTKAGQFVENTQLTVNNRGKQAADISISINASAKKTARVVNDVTTWIIPWRQNRQEEKK